MKKSTKIMAVCFSVAAVAATAGIIYMNTKGAEKKYACIYEDNTLIHKINLSDVKKPYEITIGGNTVRIEKGQISMIDADCPDEVCVKQGAISDDAKPIVCLPNNIVIKLTNNEDDVDISPED